MRRSSSRFDLNNFSLTIGRILTKLYRIFLWSVIFVIRLETRFG